MVTSCTRCDGFPKFQAPSRTRCEQISGFLATTLHRWRNYPVTDETYLARVACLFGYVFLLPHTCRVPIGLRMISTPQPVCAGSEILGKPPQRVPVPS